MIHWNIFLLRFEGDTITLPRSQERPPTGSFELGGWHYLLPGTAVPEAAHPTDKVHPVAVADIPHVLLPCLRDRLAESLRAVGEVRVAGEVIHFTPADSDRTYQLALRYDPEPLYHVLVIQDDMAALNPHLLRRHLRVLEEAPALQTLGVTVDLLTPSKAEALPSPKMYFHAAGLQEVDATMAGAVAPRNALLKHGPCDRIQFSVNPHHVLMILDPSTRLDAEELLGQFLNGMRTGGHAASERQMWPDGWGKTFHLQDVAHKVASRSDLQSVDSLQRTLQAQEAGGRKVSLVFYTAAHPDLQLENWLLRLGVPWCHIELNPSKPKQHPSRAQFLFDLGLRAYAKLGGTAWLMAPAASIRHYVLVGVGTAGEGVEAMGYATVFSQQGFFHVGKVGWDTESGTWAEKLHRFLEIRIQEIARQEGWQEGDEVEMVLHLDMVPAEEDVQALAAALQQAHPDYAVHLSCLSFYSQHDYRLWAADTGQVQGAARGTRVRVGAKSELLQLNMKRAAKPWLIRFHGDLEGVHNHRFRVAEVYQLSFLSAYSAEPAPLPVTLDYGRRIVQKCAELKRLSPDFVVPESFHHIPWFL